jgi:hypothetical protein
MVQVRRVASLGGATLVSIDGLTNRKPGGGSRTELG